MKILLIGHNGQLGYELHRTLSPLGEVVAVDYPDINLADLDSVRALVRSVVPQVIVNPAAYTTVDKAESEPQLAWTINAEAPGVLAEEANRSNAGLIHFSTDYVFDGTASRPYLETDTPNPLSEYGISKLGGERAVQEAGDAYLVFRTSWVYSNRTGGFVNKVLEWSRQQKVMRVVTDQVACPTWCRALAEITAQVLVAGREDVVPFLREKRGLYNLAGSGIATRYEWTKKILELDPKRSEQVVQEIQPALTADFPTPAKRPLYSALNSDRFYEIFSLCLPDWTTSLKLSLT
jgi:dTDP-4-dehydrorhamnose reductase